MIAWLKAKLFPQSPAGGPGDFSRENAELIKQCNSWKVYANLWISETREAARARNGERETAADELAQISLELYQKSRAYYSRWKLRD